MKVDHITLLVRSFERSMPYYDALFPLLGFSKQRERIWTDGEGFFIQFGEARDETRPYERYGAGMNHIGFGAPSPEAVERIREKMKAAGFDVPAIQNLGGAVALFMKDPDGLRFEITYYPEGVNVVD